MFEEQDRRRSGFRRGVMVRMADGRLWTLAMPSPEDADPEVQAVLMAISESEDQAERLRGELGLTILLLSRNYDLTPDEYQRILCFAPDDPALIALQRAVHTLAQESVRTPQSHPLSNPKAATTRPRRATDASAGAGRNPPGWSSRIR